jgi:DNA polymerase-3 subunit delta'
MPFRDVTGHRALLALLSRAILRETLPQSLIFSGPDGIGKKLAAIGAAQALNCQQRLTSDAPGSAPLDACGICPVCRRIAQGNHPDVILTTGVVSMEQVRGAIDSSGYRPFEGRLRVFIFDDADRLSSEVQNALLKTLEEPPPSSSFILVSSRPELLLPTVRSRCPMLRFGRLSPLEIEGLLVERHGFDAQQARAASLVGEGSVAQALASSSEEGGMTRGLIEQVLQTVQSARSPADRLRAAGMLLEPGEAPRPRGRTKGKSLSASDRELLGQRLASLTATLRDVAALSTGADRRCLSALPTSELEALGQGFGTERLLAAFATIAKAQEALDRNVSPKNVADWLAMQI